MAEETALALYTGIVNPNQVALDSADGNPPKWVSKNSKEYESYELKRVR